MAESQTVPLDVLINTELVSLFVQDVPSNSIPVFLQFDLQYQVDPFPNVLGVFVFTPDGVRDINVFTESPIATTIFNRIVAPEIGEPRGDYVLRFIFTNTLFLEFETFIIDVATEQALQLDISSVEDILLDIAPL